MSDTRDTVLSTISAIMEVDVSTVTETTGAADLDTWDSLRQLNLVMALEEALDIEFPEDEIPHLSSAQKILEVLATLGLK